MKKNKALLFTLLLTLPIQSLAQGIKFEETNWEQIIGKAKAENKLVFLDAYASWCGPCKWMAREVFTQEEVGKFYNENFVCAKIDMEKGEGVELAKKYGVNAYPTFLYIQPSGEIVYKALGGREAKEFIQVGKNALNPEMRLSKLNERFANGERSSKFMTTYLNALDDAGESTDKVAAVFLENSTEDELLSEGGAKLLLRYLPSIDHTSFQFLQANKGKVEELVGEEKVDKTIYSLYEKSYKSLATKTTDGYQIDIKAFESFLEKIKSSDYSRAKELEMKAYMFYYQVTDDIKKYAVSVSAYMDMFPPEGWQEYNKYAWFFYENVDDKQLLKKALSWITKSISIDENYYNVDTRAALLFKLGTYTDAEQAANKAIGLAMAAEEDYSETEKLLEKIREAKK